MMSLCMCVCMYLMYVLNVLNVCMYASLCPTSMSARISHAACRMFHMSVEFLDIFFPLMCQLYIRGRIVGTVTQEQGMGGMTVL